MCSCGSPHEIADAASTIGSCEGKVALLTRSTALLQTSVQEDGTLTLVPFAASTGDERLYLDWRSCTRASCESCVARSR